MSESINNYNINNSYTYNNSELQKYDTDEDGNLSLFEIENIEDEQDYQLLLEDIENQNTSEEEDIETQISNLESLLDNAENSQGIIGKAWNGIKNVTGIGLSIKKCEQAIDDFKNGKITYDEAYTKISKFSQKQENSVDFVSNMVSGTAAALVVGSAILTGGLSLGIVAGAAAIGAATKAGLKFADRATNKVKGDALDAKQIAKDSLSGAVNGAVSVATMGIGSTAAVTGETIASQTLKQTIIQGAKAGAAEGAVSGAVIGASDYTIDAVFEDDVDFNIEDLAKSTATNAAGGAIFGGIIGGVTSGVQYSKVSSSLKNDTTADVDLPNASEASNNSQLPDSTETKLPSVASSKQDTGEIQIPDEIAAELKKQAEDLNGEFKANINEATGQIEKEFGSLSSVEEKGITGRAKGEDSILAKLEKKFENQKLTDTSKEACTDAIGDAYGTRVQLKSLSTERSKEIIEDCLSGSDITYEQFIQYMNGDTLNLDDAGISA
ncbi:MAG: hypothetical protein LUH11_01120, partial [Candidatus Gastranaerophilales bacterium]|nr:hypothetical protein [Candidatus Gastranaerophilales bacterium]